MTRKIGLYSYYLMFFAFSAVCMYSFGILLFTDQNILKIVALSVVLIFSLFSFFQNIPGFLRFAFIAIFILQFILISLFQKYIAGG